MNNVPWKLLCVPLALALLFPTACVRSRESESQRNADANSPAGKLGKAAHAVAVETGKAADVIGRDLDKAARQAHAGWQQAAQQEKEKKHNQ